MTKPRIPHTWPAAVTRIADRLGWSGAAAAVGKSEGLVRAWSDDATGKRPSLDQALALSVAYADAGGEGEPFVDAFAFQIGVRTSGHHACVQALLQEIGTVSLELGQAVAASLTLASSNASPLDAMRAFAEAKQATDALEALQRRLACFLPSDAGSSAGNPGGPHVQ